MVSSLVCKTNCPPPIIVGFLCLWKPRLSTVTSPPSSPHNMNNNDAEQATLIIRHPDDGKLYVNFDQEILQLIREAKILDRMGIEIPESAKIALFQV